MKDIQEHEPTVVAVAEPVDPTILTSDVYGHHSSVYGHHAPPAAESRLMSAVSSFPMDEGRSIAIVDDVEAQKAAPAAASSTPSGYNDEAGKSIGIAMFICIMVAFVSGFFVHIHVFLYAAITCSFVAILLASSITCGCCCGSNLNIHPKVKRWSTATLICLVIQWILALANIGLVYIIADYDVLFVALASWIIAQILCVIAAIFAAMFTWGRKCCGGI